MNYEVTTYDDLTEQDGMDGIMAMSANIFKQAQKAVTPNYAEIFKLAKAAGLKAGNEHTPAAMVVGTPMDILAANSPLDRSKRMYYVADGVCGFASVRIPDGRSGFAKWLKKHKGGYAAYYGGTAIHIHEHDQSYERKVKHAGAFVRVLDSFGIKAYVESRLD
jgi:hypothetical protein